VEFFDAVSEWPRIQPHLGDAEFNRILNRDFHRFVYGRWREPFPTKERPLPGDFEGYNGHVGRYLGPDGPYRAYILDLACHWLVNSQLRLAQLVLPNMQWRIIASRQNHTVWNSDGLLFDLVSQGLYGSADISFEFSFGFGRLLAPGEYLPVKYAEHFHLDLERKNRGVPYGRCPFCLELATGHCCAEYAAFVPQSNYRRVRDDRPRPGIR
jgi:hypothetical protein